MYYNTIRLPTAELSSIDILCPEGADAESFINNVALRPECNMGLIVSTCTFFPRLHQLELMGDGVKVEEGKKCMNSFSFVIGEKLDENSLSDEIKAHGLDNISTQTWHESITSRCGACIQLAGEAETKSYTLGVSIVCWFDDLATARRKAQ